MCVCSSGEVWFSVWPPSRVLSGALAFSSASTDLHNLHDGGSVSAAARCHALPLQSHRSRALDPQTCGRLVRPQRHEPQRDQQNHKVNKHTNKHTHVNKQTNTNKSRCWDGKHDNTYHSIVIDFQVKRETTTESLHQNWVWMWSRCFGLFILNCLYFIKRASVENEADVILFLFILFVFVLQAERRNVPWKWWSLLSFCSPSAGLRFIWSTCSSSTVSVLGHLKGRYSKVKPFIIYSPSCVSFFIS